MKNMTMKEELQAEYKEFLSIETFQNNGISIKLQEDLEEAIIPQIIFNFYNSVFLKSGYTGKIDVI